MKNLAHCCALVFFVVLYGAQARKNGGYGCDHLFENRTGSITNNTLKPDTSCKYHIVSVNKTIHIMLRKLFLDVMDNVTIMKSNESEALFPVFHGQEESVPLITGETNVTVIIEVSSARNVTRHFELFYDTVAPDCTFVINDESKLQQPLSADGKSIECRFQYNAKHTVLLFSFLNFNMSQGSQISVTGTENPQTSFSGQERPPDLITALTAQAAFDVKMSSQKDHFVMQQLELNPACSGYKKLTGSEKISSPPMPKLDNGSLITECRWYFESDSDKSSLNFTLNSINLNSPYDMLVITDGKIFDSPPLLQITSGTEKETLDQVVITRTGNLIVSFKPSSLLSNFSANIRDTSNGHFLMNNGTITMSGPSNEDIMWLLQVGNNENVILNFKDSSIKAPARLDVYDDFSFKKNPIASIHENIWYPLLSKTPRMMLVASNINKPDQFSAEFHGSVAGCMHMSQGSSDSYVLSGNCNSSCSWIIAPIGDKSLDLFVNLQYISLESNDFVEVFRLDANRTLITNITTSITYVPQMSLPATEGALVRVTRGTCPKKPDAIILVAQSHYLRNCSDQITMTRDKSIQLTSPNFPNTYPVMASCEWNLTSSPSKQLIHIAFDKLSLAPNHSIVIAGIGTAPTKLTGSSLPDDFFFKTDVVIRFDSNGNSMESSTGFALNATSTDCGGILTSETGQLTTTANKSLCIWLISVPPTTGDSVNIIIFSVKPKDKTGNYKLDVYDGASIRDSVISNTSDSELWSRTNNLIIVYQSINISAASSEVSISYRMQGCNKTMQCDNKICLHHDWRCNGHNDCGDFTDERACQPVPVVPKPGGISPVVFGVVIVLVFCAGVLLALFVPKLKNFRSQYRQFRDVSVIE